VSEVTVTHIMKENSQQFEGD